MTYSDKPWLTYYDEKIGVNSDVPNISLTEMLESSVSTYSDKVAITFYEKKWTYKELHQMVENFASSLHSIDFQKSDGLAIMLPNTPHYLFSLFASSRLAGISVQVNPMYVAREIEHILNDSGAKYMVVLDQLYSKVKAVQEKTSLEHIIVVSLSNDKIDIEDGDFHFNEFIAKATSPAPQTDIDPANTIALLQYTGGTTGVSKGVMLTHQNILANVEQINDFMFKVIEKPDNPKIMSILPMFHIYGLTCNVFLGVKVGCNQIILPRFDVQEVMETVRREVPFQFSGVPTMYVALNNHPKLEDYGFDKVGFYNSGGSAMPVEQLHLFEKRTGCNLCEGYGLSEASPTTHFNPAFRERKVGSIGIPLPGLEARIVRLEDNGYENVPVGEVGELIVKGPQVMKGYWNRPNETEATLIDGWLHTGDMARMDEDGYFYIVDRKKDLIIASGYNVYPREVEEVLYQHQSVREVIVVGIPDEYRGETVKAFVSLKDREIVSEDELILFTKKHLAPYKVPKLIEFKQELPKSAVGKLLRRELRDQEYEKLK